MSLPKMRTAVGVMTAIKEMDPQTEITLHYIRYIIRTEQIPVVHVGRKKLVDFDRVLEYISGGSSKSENSIPGKIRKIGE